MIMNILTLFVCINIGMMILPIPGTPFYVNGTESCFFPETGAPSVDPTVYVPAILYSPGAPGTGTVTLASAVAGNIFTANGLAYLGVNGIKADDTQFSVDSSDTAAALDLAASISNDIRTGITVPSISLSASSNVGVVSILSNTNDAAANAVDLSENTGATTIVVSASTLTGAVTSIDPNVTNTLNELVEPTNSTNTDLTFGDGNVLNNFFDTVDQAAKSMEVMRHVISGGYIMDTIDHFSVSCGYDADGNLLAQPEHAVWTQFKEGIKTLIFLLGIFTLFYWATGRGHILTS